MVKLLVNKETEVSWVDTVVDAVFEVVGLKIISAAFIVDDRVNINEIKKMVMILFMY